MDKRELRIGNIVSDQFGNVWEIGDWSGLGIVSSKVEKYNGKSIWYDTTLLRMEHIKKLNPVPMTREILLSWGAKETVYNSEEDGFGSEYLLDFNGVMAEVYDDFSVTLFNNDPKKEEGVCIGIYKYVHSFQNLIYGLLGIELTLNNDNKN